MISDPNNIIIREVFFLKNLLALPFQRHVFLLSAKIEPKLHNKAVSNLGTYPKIFA